MFPYNQITCLIEDLEGNEALPAHVENQARKAQLDPEESQELLVFPVLLDRRERQILQAHLELE